MGWCVVGFGCTPAPLDPVTAKLAELSDAQAKATEAADAYFDQVGSSK